MKPHDMGVLFDECAERGVRTRFHLDRPFDLAGYDATDYSVPELAALVRRAAGWFAAAGAEPSDRVAIVKPNHWDYDVLACAAVRIGAVPAQLSAELPRQSLLALLRRLQPKLLVTTAGLWQELREGQPPDLAPAVLLLDGSAPGALSVEDVAGIPAPSPYRRHDDEPLVVNHTSGTTGVPKLVVHSTRTIIGKLARFETVRYPKIGVRRDDTLLNANSFAHGRTFCWTASALCLDPAEIAILTTQDPDLADPVLRAHPPTMVEALPAVYVRFRPLTARLDNPFRRVRLFISTYDAMHPPTIRSYLRASAHRAPLWMQGWGQTETGPLTFRFHTRRSAAHDRDTSRGVGRPVPGKTRLRVVDPDSFRPLGRGHTGLVLARTAACAAGYVEEGERWAAKRHGGWFNTGDLGRIRGDGSVELLDREVDRSERLSCLRTEDLLEDRLPQAAECVLLSPSGRTPLPVVVTDDGTLDRDAWDRAVRGLPPLGEPVALTWDQVPRTGTGKVRRTALLRQLTGSGETVGSGRWT